MLWPMVVLAGLCVLIGLLAPAVLGGMGPAVAVLVGARAEMFVPSGLEAAAGPLSWIVSISIALAFVAIILGSLRMWLLSKRPIGETGTWDCGYARPTARMQYTASSFAQPLTGLFQPILRTRHGGKNLEGLLPSGVSFFTETRDLFRNQFYDPLFVFVAGLLAPLRKAQHGRVQGYVLYIVLTLIALLIFSLELGP